MSRRSRAFTRREVAKLLALVPTLSLWPKVGRATPAPAPTPQPLQEPEPPGAASLADYVRASFGDRLSPEQIEEVSEQIARRLSGTALRDFELSNGDEPGFVFRVLRAD